MWRLNTTSEEAVIAEMPSCTDRIYLALVHCEPEGDAWFPAYDESQWQVTERIDNHANERNPVDYSFLILVRK